MMVTTERVAGRDGARAVRQYLMKPFDREALLKADSSRGGSEHPNPLAPRPRRAAEAPIREHPMRMIRVLVVDDVAMVRRLVVDALSIDPESGGRRRANGRGLSRRFRYVLVWTTDTGDGRART